MSTQRIKARPTTYKGIQMRSRLEASFAAWLDEHGWPWEYEPQCFGDETGQYLPDFHLTDGSDIYYEVKPNAAFIDLDDELRRMHVILSSEPEASLLVMTEWPSAPGLFNSRRKCSPDQPCATCSG